MGKQGCDIKWTEPDTVVISGIIDEYADFSSLSQRAQQSLNVDLSQVTRMNSSGIRTWIQSIMRHKIELNLTNCSPVVVEQFSMIPEFIGKNGFVESFQAQFICGSCGTETQDTFQVGVDVFPGQNYSDHVLEKTCPSCGQSMDFDHNPEIYFSFLRTMKPRLPKKAS